MILTSIICLQICYGLNLTFFFFYNFIGEKIHIFTNQDANELRVNNLVYKLNSKSLIISFKTTVFCNITI